MDVLRKIVYLSKCLFGYRCESIVGAGRLFFKLSIICLRYSVNAIHASDKINSKCSITSSCTRIGYEVLNVGFLESVIKLENLGQLFCSLTLPRLIPDGMCQILQPSHQYGTRQALIQYQFLAWALAKAIRAFHIRICIHPKMYTTSED